MKSRANKTNATQSRSIAGSVRIQNNKAPTSHFVDNRPEAIQVGELQQLADSSSQARQATRLQGMADDYSAQQLSFRKKTDNTQTGASGGNKTKLSPHLTHNSPQRDVTQRVIIYAGADSLAEEAKKKEGFIVLSLIAAVMQLDGSGRNIVEMQDINSIVLDIKEDIYITGHGIRGRIGVADPAKIAKLLKPKIPSNWEGQIFIHSCQAGSPMIYEGRSASSILYESLDRGVKITAPKGNQSIKWGDSDEQKLERRVSVTDNPYESQDEFFLYFMKRKPEIKFQKKILGKYLFKEGEMSDDEIREKFKNTSYVTEKYDETFTNYRSSQFDEKYHHFGKRLFQYYKENHFFDEHDAFLKFPNIKREWESIDLYMKHSETVKDWRSYIESQPLMEDYASLMAVATQAGKISRKFHSKVIEYGDKYKLFKEDAFEILNKEEVSFKSQINKSVVKLIEQLAKTETTAKEVQSNSTKVASILIRFHNERLILSRSFKEFTDLTKKTEIKNVGPILTKSYQQITYRLPGIITWFNGNAALFAEIPEHIDKSIGFVKDPTLLTSIDPINVSSIAEDAT